MGEAAAVLRNYERRTGETLSREDLEEHRLAEKLTPEDYDLKNQVPHLSLYPNMFTHFNAHLSDQY